MEPETVTRLEPASLAVNNLYRIKQRNQRQARIDSRPGTLAEFEALIDPLTNAADGMAAKIQATKIVAHESWDVWNHLDRAAELAIDLCNRLTEATIYAQLADEKERGIVEGTVLYEEA